MAQFYYPEGLPGPICDAIIPDVVETAAERAKRLADAAEPRTKIITPVRPPNDATNWPLYTVCDIDEEGNLVNCQPVFDRAGPYEFVPIVPNEDAGDIEDIPYPADFGITDDFFVPLINKYSCIPFDPDINIRPVTFFSRVGNLITRYPYPKSNVLTYPVNAVIGVTQSSITVNFSEDGSQVIIDGEGKGSVTVKLEWDDNPNTLGVALDSVTVGGSTLTRSGTSGSAEATLQVSAGTILPLTFSNLNPANANLAERLQGNSLCLLDGNIGGTYPITYTGLNAPTSDIDVAQNGQNLRIDDDPTNGFDENAKFEIRSTSSNINAEFTDAETLSITGDGGGSVTLRLEWDDNPNTSGTAVDTISVGGQTWTRSGEQGSQEFTISVSPGGGGGDDCNATLSIGASTGGDPKALSLWTENGDRYGVWTNPAQCTLPCLQQVVLYDIEFPRDNIYYFEFGADDEGEFFFDNESTPFAACTTGTILNPDLFPTATGPLIVPKYVTAGKHQMVAKVTNGAPGGFGLQDLYIDTSVDWGSVSPGAGTAIRQELDGPASGVTISAAFDSAGNNLVVTGSGEGTVTFTYEWDDDITENGKALDSIQIRNSTINQTGASTTYTTSPLYRYLNNTQPGPTQFNWVITGQSSNAGFQIIDGGQTIRWDDDANNSFDENARMEIKSINQDGNSSVTCNFTSDGSGITIGGSGSATVELEFTWDDSPGISDQAVGTLQLLGETFSQGNNRTGSITRNVSVQAASDTGDHFTGLDPNPPNGYTSEGILCHVFTTPRPPGTFRIRDREPGKPQSSYDAFGFSPSDNAPFTIEGQQVETIPIYAKTNGSDVMWTNTANEGLGQGYEPDYTNSANGIAFYAMANPTSVVVPSASSGRESRTITVNGGQTYPITYTGLNSANTPINVVSDTEICFKDGAGSDCNGILTITASTENNTGMNEVSGFVVPDDSPTGKYLSFGTITAGPLVQNRSASITLDLTGAKSISFWCIAGTDTNGGERPNDPNETLEVNFGTGWVVLLGSKQYYDISFAQYDGRFGAWTNYTVEVPLGARVANKTINLRSTGDVPEIGGDYLGLTPANFAATYANCGDVFGIYKITTEVEVPPNCDNPSDFAHNWATNPGGWYVKICEGAPCIKGETLDWGPVNGRGRAASNAWGTFMDTYAIWPEGYKTLAGIPQTISFTIYLTRDDTINLEYSGDNRIQFLWNGTQVVDATGTYGTSNTLAINATRGEYILTMTVTNAPGVGTPPDNSWDGNPAGGAFVISYSNGETIRTSLDLDQNFDGNMIWNTREAVLYGWLTDCSLNDVESIYGTGFEGYVLYNDGTLDRGAFIDTLKPGYTLQPVTSGSGFVTNYTVLHEAIVQAYILDIKRYPEPTRVDVGRLTGYDGWINHFRTQPVNSIAQLQQQIYNTYITSVANGGSGEQAYQQSKGGVQGTYDSCDIQRV